MNTHFTNLKLALAALTFASIANAHPKFSDSLDKVGVGSTLTVTQDINVKPNEQVIWFRQSDRVNTPRFDQCILRLSTKSPADRVIKAGKNLVISSVETWIGDYHKEVKESMKIVTLKFSGMPAIQSMECSEEIFTDRNLGLYPFDISIAGATSALAPYFQIKLAEPTEL